MRLLFVADVIPPELERIVEFLNKNIGSVDVAAIEIKQFVGGVQTTLVSRLLGQSAATRQSKSVARNQRSWDEESFLARLQDTGEPEDVAVMQKLVAWSRDRFTGIAWGHGKTDGSARPFAQVDGTDYFAYVLGTWSGGTVEIQFFWMASRAPFDDVRLRDELRVRLNRIDSVHLSASMLERRPSIPLKALRDDDQLQRFYDAIDWFLATARADHSESGGE
jgi:hypothetical protein